MGCCCGGDNIKIIDTSDKPTSKTLFVKHVEIKDNKLIVTYSDNSTYTANVAVGGKSVKITNADGTKLIGFFLIED